MLNRKMKPVFKRITFPLLVLFVFIVILTNLSSASNSSITVKKAIANNQGEATVEGYIVGITNSGPSYQFTAPFQIDTNLAIADKANETSKSKILPVQLPSGAIRSNLNLKDHPEILGKKVKVHGKLTAYFGVPGLKSPKSYEIIDSTTTPTEPSTPIYTSEVASVVDGDTIHLTTPVLGTTKVRFVNVDTPETYHRVQNEADQNQKDHGELAKKYLHELLPIGTKIELLVGKESKDSYGRLLAQVVRKQDKLNVNLNMVAKGYAVTYFIWPIEDKWFPSYSDAVKKAYESNLGIWNNENPLQELPFVFRAREQGKGLLRYVGNYHTKTYVSPEEWRSVPVESRVFFSNAEEAVTAGYKAE